MYIFNYFLINYSALIDVTFGLRHVHQTLDSTSILKIEFKKQEKFSSAALEIGIKVDKMPSKTNNLRDKLEENQLDLSLMQFTEVPVKEIVSAIYI